MSEVKKRKKGQILNNNERQLILNLMTYLKEKNSGKSVSEVTREISRATGCSERTIYKIRKEASKGITIKENRKRLRKKENKNSRNVKYDSYVKSAIRKTVHNYFLQNIPPTLNRILCLVNNDPNLPNFKRSTLHTLLKEIGFVYEQKGKKSLLTERNDLVKSRRQYLTDIRKFRTQNRWIIYTGETLISLMRGEIRKDELVKNPKDQNLPRHRVEDPPMAYENVTPVFVNASELFSGNHLVYTIDASALADAGNLQLGGEITTIQEISYNPDNIPIHRISTGDCLLIEGFNQTINTEKEKTDNNRNCSQKNISERELRLTVMHAVGSHGFIQGADFVTVSNKKMEEIDSYEHWFTEILLPKIPPNSVIVTDNNAPYHKIKENNIPDESWKKQQIKNWLLSKNISIENITLKKDLLAIVNEMRPLYSTKCKIKELAKQKGIIIVNLPPYHYELNPLNMVWSHIKCHVKSNMKSFKIKKIKQLIREGFYTISQVNWQNYIQHVTQTEDMLWSVDELQESNKNLNLSEQQNDEDKETIKL